MIYVLRINKWILNLTIIYCVYKLGHAMQIGIHLTLPKVAL